MKTILVLVMMMTLNGFGVTVTDKVLSAIAMKESGNRNGVKGDLHLKTPSVGVYQIRTDYLKDVLRVYGTEAKKTFGRTPTMEDMQYNPKMAKWVVSHYLQYYGRVYQKRTGKTPTAEVYFMIHNGGPNGYNKNKYPSLYACTSKYAKSAMKYYKT